MSDNLRIYNAVRAVPPEAKRPIQGGRLKGKTDINPMWRIKKMTEQFGPCGEGWGYTIDRLWIEEGAKGERCSNAMISLWYKKEDGTRSDPIPGIGGNMLVKNESGGLQTFDECYKSALTDAFSVAFKALGIGADVYWSEDSTKYTSGDSIPQSAPAEPPDDIAHPRCTVCGKLIAPVTDKRGTRTPLDVAEGTQRETGYAMCYPCFNAWRQEHGNR